MNENHNRAHIVRKFSALIFLVLFVFVILFISITISGAISYFLINLNILPSLSAHKYPTVLIFMLIVSLLIGTIMALIGGDYFLRPLRALSDATVEIASGNFDVRVEPKGLREINCLAKSFNQMAKELSSIEKLRDDFISNISHEFKTPVASIRGFARRLKKNDLTEEQQREYLDIIISETERLAQLSGNILLLSKLENTYRHPEKTTFLLDEQIRKSILLLDPQISKKQLELIINLKQTEVTANEEMLQHVWLNLLGNAIKFTPEEGSITVSLTSDEDVTIISVSDTGPGISEEEKQYVFDEFYQGDPSRATQGNGLGLSLVKKILELNHGRIAVDSSPGKGACFTVILPKNCV